MNKPHILLFSLLILQQACSSSIDSHTIASIPEASGISFCENSNTLVVANDEGSFYEITLQGKIIKQHNLGKYDLEAVVCEKEEFIFAVEDGALLQVDRSTLNSKLLKIKGGKIKISKKSGIEGMTKIGQYYYVTLQSKKKKNAKFLILKRGENYAKVVNEIHHGIIDSAGMQYIDKKLYIVSDKKDKLYVYNLKKNKIQKKVKLAKFAQEGITFDNKGNVYFADDDGAVIKYRKKELRL